MLSYEKFGRRIALSGLGIDRLMFDYLAVVIEVQAGSVPLVVERDPDDNHVVAAAIAASADAIVSGDDDLLSLQEAAGIPVLRAAEALTLFT